MKRSRLNRERLHKALIAVATEDVELLSYKGQTLWNKLASCAEKRDSEVKK